MRLNNEGKSTSKMWLVGGAVGAIVLAAGAAMIAGGPRPEPAPPAEEVTAPPADANAANPADAANTANGASAAANSATANGATANGATANSATNSAGNAAGNAANAAGKPAATKPAAAPAAGKTSVKPGAPAAGKVKMVDGIKIEDLVVGTGAEAVPGKRLTMDYRGTLMDGTVFDESYKRGEPFSFNLGAGEVIQGWDKGVPGMKVGGKRRLTIPSELAYGERGAGGTIPPNADLKFEIELRAVD